MKINLFSSLVAVLVLVGPTARADLGIATEHEKICASNAKKAALVVIDMQPVFVTRGGNHKKPQNVEVVRKITEAQIEAIKIAKEHHVPIVFLEYAGWGKTNETLKAAVSGYDKAKFFLKTTDGMFDEDNKRNGGIQRLEQQQKPKDLVGVLSAVAEWVKDHTDAEDLGRSPLINYLRKNDVGTLVITGANGGACVRSSIRGSLQGNCSVIAYSKGIADFNYEDFIYPYTGLYANMKTECADCKLKEVSSIDTVENILGLASSGERPDFSNLIKETEGNTK